MIFGINLISIGIVVTVVAAILATVVILTKIRNHKRLLEKIKERRDANQDYADLTEKLKGLYSKLTGEASSPIVLPAILYIAILVSFAILLPDTWAWYWSHKDFFWISQVYLITFVVSSYLKTTSLKWSLRIAFTVILAVYGIGKIPEGPPNGTETEVVIERRIESYGNWLVDVGPEWSAEYGIPKSGGIMRIKRVNPKIPLTYWLTLMDDTKKIIDIPSVNEGYGDIILPDYKRLRIQAPEETTIWVITKPLNS